MRSLLHGVQKQRAVSNGTRQRRSVKRKPANSSVSDNSQETSTPSVRTKVSKFRKADIVNGDSGGSTKRTKRGNGTFVVSVPDKVTEENMAKCGELLREEVEESLGDTRVSNEDLLRELRGLTNTANATKTSVDQMREEIDKLRGEVFELKQEKDKLRKEIDESKKREEGLKREVGEAKFQAATAHRRTLDLEQYTRRNNIRVFGVKEADSETLDQCEKKVIRILHDKMGLRHVTPEHIEIAHRTGEKPDSPADPPRPIIVKFTSRKTIQQVFQNKKKLFQTPFMIVEDLTKENYHLLLSCKDHPRCESAWSLRGKIYVRMQGGRSMQVKSASELDAASLEQPRDFPPFSSTPQHGFRGRGLGLRSGFWRGRGQGGRGARPRREWSYPRDRYDSDTGRGSTTERRNTLGFNFGQSTGVDPVPSRCDLDKASDSEYECNTNETIV